MARPEHAAPLPDLTTEVGAEAVDQPRAPDLADKLTRKVDTDEMFVRGGD